MVHTLTIPTVLWGMADIPVEGQALPDLISQTMLAKRSVCWELFGFNLD